MRKEQKLYYCYYIITIIIISAHFFIPNTAARDNELPFTADSQES